MIKISRYIESLIDLIGRAVSWLSLFMVLGTCLIVLLRYGFDIGSIAMQEAINYMHAMVFLLGAAYTLKYNEHVRVDIFYAGLSARKKAYVDLLGNLFILMPVMIFIFWISWQYVADSWQVLESSREAGGLAGVYILKTFILLMPVLLFIQALANILQSLTLIINREKS